MNTKTFIRTRKVCRLANELGLMISEIDPNNPNDLELVRGEEPYNSILIKGSLDDIELYINRISNLKVFL
jgi:hypothetical protein